MKRNVFIREKTYNSTSHEDEVTYDVWEIKLVDLTFAVGILSHYEIKTLNSLGLDLLRVLW